MKYKKGDLVKIKFLDSESRPGWTYPEQGDDLKEVMYLYVIGYFLRKDKDFTIISMGYSDKGGVLNAQKIPTGCIIKLEKI